MDQLLTIELTNLMPDPTQPRKDFDDEKIQELAGSISVLGVKTPISVRLNVGANNGEPQYMIIAGERRWRASMLAGKQTIPAVLVQNSEELTEDALYAHQLTENLHRENLNPVEKAEFINTRMEYLKAQGVGNVVEKVAGELGVSIAWVSKTTAILKYKPDIRALARDGKLRDYTMLKKLNNLDPAKQAKAISLIESGEFNSKEFFARKRYDKKKVVPEVGRVGEGALPEKSVKEQKIAIQFNTSDFVKLVEKTDFKSILDSTDAEWRRASSLIMKAYAGKFKDWIAQE